MGAKAVLLSGEHVELAGYRESLEYLASLELGSYPGVLVVKHKNGSLSVVGEDEVEVG